MKQHFNTGNRRSIIDQITSQVSLRVQINTQAFLSALLANSGKEPRSVRFANATFQIQNRDDLGSTMCRGLHMASVAPNQAESREKLLARKFMVRFRFACDLSPPAMFLDAHAAFFCQNDVIDNRDAKRLADLLHSVGNIQIFPAWCCIPGRMVVGK